jgi:hypothetical protein
MRNLSESVTKQFVLFTKLLGTSGDAVAAGNTLWVHFFHGPGPDSHETDFFTPFAIGAESGPFAVKPYPKR